MLLLSCVGTINDDISTEVPMIAPPMIKNTVKSLDAITKILKNEFKKSSKLKIIFQLPRMQSIKSY
jgi:hypothetical protein